MKLSEIVKYIFMPISEIRKVKLYGRKLFFFLDVYLVLAHSAEEKRMKYGYDRILGMKEDRRSSGGENAWEHGVT